MPSSPEPEPEFDAFLSYASEDGPWCEQLAERLRNEGVRVWFDKWQLQPGDHLEARINDGLERSRKMIAVWSTHYFRQGKVWTLAESYSRQHEDMLAQDRPLIPLLIEDCQVKPTLASLIHLDMRNPADFDLRFHHLLQALDLPRRDRDREADVAPFEQELACAERGRVAHAKGKRFEDEVAALYRLLDFEVTPDTEVAGFQIDLQIHKREGGLTTDAFVECKNSRVTSKERDQLLAQQNIAQKKLPRHRWIVVSSQGFAADTRAALDGAGFDCITHAELLRELVPLDKYVEQLIAGHEAWVQENWNGEDWFIRPSVETDVTYERRSAIARRKVARRPARESPGRPGRSGHGQEHAGQVSGVPARSQLPRRSAAASRSRSDPAGRGAQGSGARARTVRSISPISACACPAHLGLGTSCTGRPVGAGRKPCTTRAGCRRRRTQGRSPIHAPA
ncbi:MAG: TIR domain-containing protein [Planctomycetes bacterium]|nr:TIR domain-containing protein [Planctomycetota bacterium]